MLNLTFFRDKVDLSSAPNTEFTIFITDIKVQIVNFNIVGKISKELKFLEKINELNSDYSFGTFYINEDSNVVYKCSLFTSNATSNDVVEVISLLIGINESAFDELMKVKYQ